MDSETYDRLFKASGMTQEELASRMGRKFGSINRYIRQFRREGADDPIVAEFLAESVLILREEVMKKSAETEEILRATENTELILA